jgi:type VI secretion system protein ImpE
MNAVKNAESALHQGEPAQALKLLQDGVRANPADPRLRVFLFQLLSVLGQWERALNQLSVAAELDAAALPMAQTYREAIQCESLRNEVFAGRKVPMIFGQPDTWLALLIESLLTAGKGDQAGAERLRQQAFDAAPASAGSLDGEAFSWLADADMRLGPVCEAVINGRYYWLPFANLRRIQFEAPADLRDVVWTPVHFEFVNGGESVGLIPTRYPGSELSAEPLVQLARRTEWIEALPGLFHGSGQRILSTDGGDKALMDVRLIEFAAVPEEGAEPADD